MSRQAERMSFSMVGQTCPEVDRAVDVMVSDIKDCTNRLRDALTEKCQEVIDLEEKVEALEGEVRRLEERLSEAMAECDRE